MASSPKRQPGTIHLYPISEIVQDTLGLFKKFSDEPKIFLSPHLITGVGW